MLETVKKFIANRRHKSFERAIDVEISRVLTHLRGEADLGYPFSSHEELFKARFRACMLATSLVSKVDTAGHYVTRSESNAFLFIAFRDINQRLNMYLEFARAREAFAPNPESPEVEAGHA